MKYAIFFITLNEKCKDQSFLYIDIHVSDCGGVDDLGK